MKLIQLKNNWWTIVVLALIACQTKNHKADLSYTEYYQTSFFKEVQSAGVFEDSKTFVDCIPKKPLAEIVDAYKEQKGELDIREFVYENFEVHSSKASHFESDTTRSIDEHISSLWPVLTHDPDSVNTFSSLIPLPHKYVVPGGRFREIYYWDSYFTQLGLILDGQDEMALNMVNNFSFLIDSIGFIPNGNRAYYLGRSQPPFYSLMVKLVAIDDPELFAGYLPYLEKEYQFWMRGKEQLSSEEVAIDRVVLMPDGGILNRYWDNFSFPRPESFREDYELIEKNGLNPEVAFRDLRAGAESGWDYSSRWFRDHQNISTIHTTEIIPIDLNSLLYHLEMTIAEVYVLKGDEINSNKYRQLAGGRKAAIMNYLWDGDEQFFVDYDFVSGKPTGVLSLAGVYPLFLNLATASQAEAVKNIVESEFLAPGGFITTLNFTGQQWDNPNAWAPLQWVTVNGLVNYGYHNVATQGAIRWTNRNLEVFQATGKMMEKYNVLNLDLLAGGGEYPLQDGFGWTNGVYLALTDYLETEKKLLVK